MLAAVALPLAVGLGRGDTNGDPLPPRGISPPVWLNAQRRTDAGSTTCRVVTTRFNLKRFASAFDGRCTCPSLKETALKRLITSAAFAVTLSGGAPAQPERSWQRYDPEMVCGYIDNQVTEYENGDDIKFRFETIIEGLAGVDDGDSPETKSLKINELWRRRHSELTCSTGSFFSVSRGSVIKFAVSRKANMFITNVTRYWKLLPEHLNRVDIADGKTVLDYVYDEIEREKRKNYSSAVPTLQMYAKLLTEAGAQRSAAQR